uniref:Uncharacterized protein n=1 Tax=Anguilla anguilla TaxID=7936 RepID=A0A0E9W0T1_ANGAN
MYSMKCTGPKWFNIYTLNGGSWESELTLLTIKFSFP